ncbi:MAG: hypothetical protein SGARI_008355, partial [Bacillariaceae sp.]
MGKSKKKNNTNNNSSSVNVVTAGGAGSPGRKGGAHNKDPRRNKPKPVEDRNDMFSHVVAAAAPSKDFQKDTSPPPATGGYALEFEAASERGHDDDDPLLQRQPNTPTRGGGEQSSDDSLKGGGASSADPIAPIKVGDLYHEVPQSSKANDLIWLFLCFIGIMASFVCYGLLLEYTTSGGRKLHELSFLFVTSGLYTLTAAAGRYVRGEEHTTIPPSRFAILGLTSMGSTFTS